MTAMGATKMHADEIETDVALVRRLLAGQFPRWADCGSIRSLRTGLITTSIGSVTTWPFGCHAWGGPPGKPRRRRGGC
jgi:hypothetical protein